MAKNNKKNYRFGKVLFIILVPIFVILVFAFFARNTDFALLNPRGEVAEGQYKLLVESTLIMVAFASVVLFALYFFAWRYRETNKKATHDPKAGQGKLMLFISWGSPIVIFVILVSMMLPATQKLVPQQMLESENEPITIQVIGMRWKWLFVYPEQNIATVNFVQIPVDTPVEFLLTVDETPMSSFWIPHLGGQLYAMTEHVNRLNLMGDTIGDFEGKTTEINGNGFSGMKFNARVSSEQDFDNWINETKNSPQELSEEMYSTLLVPSERNKAAFYSNPTAGLFSSVVSKYAGSHNHGEVVEVEGYGGH